LHRIEVAASHNNLMFANGIIDTEEFEANTEFYAAKADKVLHFTAKGIPAFVNTDPRGHALKIEPEYVRDLRIHRDMGGYGIICPEF
jgi:hypothetical protein